MEPKKYFIISNPKKLPDVMKADLTEEDWIEKTISAKNIECVDIFDGRVRVIYDADGIVNAKRHNVFASDLVKGRCKIFGDVIILPINSTDETETMYYDDAYALLGALGFLSVCGKRG